MVVICVDMICLCGSGTIIPEQYNKIVSDPTLFLSLYYSTSKGFNIHFINYNQLIYNLLWPLY